MAFTNFTKLTTEQKKVWSRDIWKVARNNSFVYSFAGTGPNAMVQRITELTRTERGDQAVVTLVPDLEGDGVAGDNQLEGNEDEIQAYDQVVTIDQLRNATRHKGKMTQQKTVVNFREQARDVLGYWAADRLDQMAFLALSGIAFTSKNDGSARAANSQLSSLAYASDVVAPSTNRHYRWDAANGLQAGDTSAVVAADTPTYGMLVDIKAQAKTNYVRGIRSGGGDEMYHMFVHPKAMAKLKQDGDFLNNVRYAMPRSSRNPLFTGAIATMDGLIIHEYRHVYTTLGATSGVDKWGAGNDVDGSRILLCGAQALAMADIGDVEWDEEEFDYGNQQAVAIGKICGLLKPQFPSAAHGGTTEDFGVIALDVAI